MAWEVSLIEWLQKETGKAGEMIAKLFSFIGGETVMLLVLLVILFCCSKEAGKRCGLKIIAATIWFPMVKNVVLRLRPYMEHETIRALQLTEADAGAMDPVQQGYSFPSGHAAMSMSIYGSLCREARKKWLWILSIVLVIMIGVSRFMAGVHYPTDVLAGWGIGLIAICFGEWMEKKVAGEQTRYLILLAISLPGIIWCRSRDYFSALGVLAAMVIAFPYEAKHIGFRDTRNVWAMILRVAGAMVIYAAMNIVLKLPFSREFLDGGTVAAGLVRSLRYGIILFTVIGVYPRVFPLYEKIGGSGKKEDGKQTAEESRV